MTADAPWYGRWWIHRVVGHRVARALAACGGGRLARRLHDATLPAHAGHLWEWD
jgi:hypothetical protein